MQRTKERRGEVEEELSMRGEEEAGYTRMKGKGLKNIKMEKRLKRLKE